VLRTYFISLSMSLKLTKVNQTGKRLSLKQICRIIQCISMCMQFLWLWKIE